MPKVKELFELNQGKQNENKKIKKKNKKQKKIHRYGSFEHAEEAFNAVLNMEPDFEKYNEIYFRLGVMYKQQHKYDRSYEVIFT